MGFAVLPGSHGLIYFCDDRHSSLLGCFHTVTQEHFPLKLLRLVGTTKLAQRVHQIFCLPSGYKLGRMDALGQQPQIVKLKLPGQQPVFAALPAVYIHPEHIPQGGNIPVDGAALRFNPALVFQIVHHISGGDGVILVRVLQKVFGNIERFHFLVF